MTTEIKYDRAMLRDMRDQINETFGYTKENDKAVMFRILKSQSDEDVEKNFTAYIIDKAAELGDPLVEMVSAPVLEFAIASGAFDGLPSMQEDDDGDDPGPPLSPADDTFPGDEDDDDDDTASESDGDDDDDDAPTKELDHAAIPLGPDDEDLDRIGRPTDIETSPNGTLLEGISLLLEQHLALILEEVASLAMGTTPVKAVEEDGAAPPKRRASNKPKVKATEDTAFEIEKKTIKDEALAKADRWLKKNPGDPEREAFCTKWMPKVKITSPSVAKQTIRRSYVQRALKKWKKELAVAAE